jgi:hypothetical protein
MSAPKRPKDGMTRDEARALMGAPLASGDAGGVGIMVVEFSWDHWISGDRLVAVFYDGPDATVGRIEDRDIPEPEPKGIETQVHADYYQFYVQDIESSCDTSVIWDVPNSTEDGVAIGPGLVAVSTKRYANVPVGIEWYPSKPSFEWEGIDRVSEAGIEVTTKLGYGMPISVQPLPVFEPVTPGLYGVRVMAWGLNTVVNDNEGGDHYIVQLWPVGKLPKLRHLKRGKA